MNESKGLAEVNPALTLPITSRPLFLEDVHFLSTTHSGALVPAPNEPCSNDKLKMTKLILRRFGTLANIQVGILQQLIHFRWHPEFVQLLHPVN